MPDPSTNPDTDLVDRIDELVEEEHRLERAHAGEGLSDEDKARLREVEIRLDQAWDLLRQRRARRDAGLDPSDVQPRSADIVEGYQQ